MKNILLNSVNEVILGANQLKNETSLNFMEQAAIIIADCFKNGNKVLIAGNGGSLCDASHFAEELTGFFRKKRKALPALALSDASHITCVGNDMGFEFIFSRSVEALGNEGDVFIALTTSGNSPNMIHAIEEASKKKIKSICFLGKGGGALKGKADLEWIIETFKTSDRIQELHMAAMHIIIELIEYRLFNE